MLFAVVFLLQSCGPIVSFESLLVASTSKVHQLTVFWLRITSLFALSSLQFHVCSAVHTPYSL